MAARLGCETLFHKVAMQPGKPVLVCRHSNDRYLVGLPGNPVSGIATAHLILGPVLGRRLGGWEPGWVELPLAEALEQKGRRRLFLPAKLAGGGLSPVRWNGSGDLIAAASADGLMDLETGIKRGAGEMIRFLPYVGVRPSEHGVIPPRRRS